MSKDIKSNPLDIAEIFNIGLNFRVSSAHRRRWLAVIEELTQYSVDELRQENKEVLDYAVDKHPLYYLEAVRRRLMVKENDSRKKSKMPQRIKDLFK